MVTGDGAREAAAEGRLIGGRYRLDQRLGSGGMGTVWAGHDLLVRREVAVKEAHTARDPVRVERVLREARAAARVSHPAVVTVYDVAMEDGHPWIVMERVRGESLADRLDREGALPGPEAARIALCVVEALAAAHERGVLHRDVKPGNVLLGEDGGVVLTDFGIAYIAGEESLTRVGEFVGSLAYTAPERMGGRHPEPASDLWSLGVLLYQMLEGRSPFHRESMEATVTAVVVEETPVPRRAGSLTPLVMTLLAKNPEERPSSAEVAARLRAAVPSAPERAAAVPPEEETTAGESATVSRATDVPAVPEAPHAPRTADAPPQPGRTADAPPETARRGSGRAPRRFTVRRRSAVVAACVLLGSLAAWGLLQNGESGRSGTPGSASHGKAPASASEGKTPASASPEKSPDSASPSPRGTTAPTGGTSRPSAPATAATAGYRPVQEDAFRAEVPAGWEARPRNAQGQFRYIRGDIEVVLVPGRDTAARSSASPLTYQRVHEPELAPFRASSWSTASGLALVEVGARRYAHGSFTWADGRGRELFVRNAALLVDGRYHLVLVIGPEARREEVEALHAHVLTTYRPAP
ncbi:serine/threonine-protein kinase [Streptomyces hydrogenans]|uniref:serine/threonine-protein kinase n=1 Tax=Streptomyces hydrogenans TaxID=1873719 RepID=UPI00343921A5